MPTARWFVFGYMNRNWEEEIDVPTWPRNSILPGGPDQGQPTHFLPRRNRFVFRVAVPKKFTEKDETDLDADRPRRDREGVGHAARRLPRGQRREGIGDRRAGRRHEQPGSAREQPADRERRGPKKLTVKVGQPLTLTAIVTDDGIPKPRAAAGLAALFGGGGARGAGAERAERPERSRDPLEQREAPLRQIRTQV